MVVERKDEVMSYKTFICGVCGAALCGHILHRAHQDADSIDRQLLKTPSVDLRLYARDYSHGEEPERPGGPLRMLQVTAVGTSTASVAIAPLFWGSSGSVNCLPRELIWNSGSTALVWPTNPSSGSNVSPSTSALAFTASGIKRFS